MPTIAEALQIAIEQHQAGRLSEAEQIYRQIIKVDANHADAWNLLGACVFDRGDVETSVKFLQRAIELNPTQGSYYRNLTVALKSLGKIENARDASLNGLQFDPDNSALYNLLGKCLLELEEYKGAVAAFHQALALDSNNIDFLNNLARGLSKQNRFEEAISYYHKAIGLNPFLAMSHNNLGNALNAIGAIPEAMNSLRRALELDPGHAETYLSLSYSFQSVGNWSDAMLYCRRAMDLQPDYLDAQYNLALLKLLTGDFESGWSEYELRWQAGALKGLQPRYEKPIWDGRALKGKTLLLHAEQGMGDTFQFIRYASMLKSQQCHLILTCSPALIPLLRQSRQLDEIIPYDDPLPYFDYFIPLLSLPKVFQTTIKTIPAMVPYLSADMDLMRTWDQRLKSISGKKVGINWHGREREGPWLKRNLPLEMFSKLAYIPGVRLCSLQKGTISPEEQRLLEQARILSFGDDFDTRNGPFMDTAAIMMNLDLVITSDTSVAHLAGALGIPVWVALPFVPDWRWLLDREDSPWYPTMRLFRQTKRGEWDDVFERMEVALHHKIKAG